MVKTALEIKGRRSLKKIVDDFDNKNNLRESLKIIKEAV